MAVTKWEHCPSCNGERFPIHVNRYGPRVRWSELICYRCGWLGSISETESDHYDQEPASRWLAIRH